LLAPALRLSYDTGGEMALSESTTEATEQVQPSRQAHAPRIGRSISLDHAAEMLGVSRRTIYNRIREGRLTTVRTLGGSQRVLIDSVDGEFRAARPTPSARPVPD
jgi:excisionase family DNA binding protein